MSDLGIYIDKLLPSSKPYKRQSDESLEDYLDRAMDYMGRIHDGLAEFGRRSRIQAQLGFTEVEIDDGTVVSSIDTGGILSLSASGSGSITIDPDNNALVFTTAATGIVSTFAASAAEIPSEPGVGDLLYITADFGTFQKGEVYSFDGTNWQEIGNRQNILIANEASDMPDEPKIGDMLYIESDFTVGDDTYSKGSVYSYTAEGWQLVGQQQFSSNVSNTSELPVNPAEGYIIYVDSSFDTFDAGRMYQYNSGNWQQIANKIGNFIAESTDDMPESPLVGDIVHINADFTYESHSYITGQRYQFDGTDWILLKDRVYNTTITDGQISITLSGYVTDGELSSTLNSYDTSSQVNTKINNSLSDYATEDYVDGSIPDLTNYATKTYVNNAIPSLAGYATENYVNNAIPDVSNYQQINAIISANDIAGSWSTANATGCYIWHNGMGFWDTTSNTWPAFLGMSMVNGQRKGYFYVGTGGTTDSDRYIHCYTVYEDSAYTTRVIVRVDEGFLGSSSAFFNITDGVLYMEDEMSTYKDIIEISAAIVDAAKIRNTSTSTSRDTLLRLAPGGFSVSSKYGSNGWVMSFLLYCGSTNGNTYMDGYNKTYIRNCTIESSNIIHPAALLFSGNGTVSGKFFDSGWLNSSSSGVASVSASGTGLISNYSYKVSHGLGTVPSFFKLYVRSHASPEIVNEANSVHGGDYGAGVYKLTSSYIYFGIDGSNPTYQFSTEPGGSTGNWGGVADPSDVRIFAWK